MKYVLKKLKIASLTNLHTILKVQQPVAIRAQREVPVYSGPIYYQ